MQLSRIFFISLIASSPSISCLCFFKIHKVISLLYAKTRNIPEPHDGSKILKFSKLIDLLKGNNSSIRSLARCGGPDNAGTRVFWDIDKPNF